MVDYCVSEISVVWVTAVEELSEGLEAGLLVLLKGKYEVDYREEDRLLGQVDQAD